MERKKISIDYVKKLQEKDEKAFNTIFAFYKDQIYAFAFSIVKNSADAEEVVQETFIKVAKNIHTLKDSNSFHSWVFKIAYHCSKEMYRKNKNVITLSYEYDFESAIEEKEKTNTLVEHNELIEILNEEIEKMPDKFEVVARLRYFEGMKVKEIAQVLDIKEGTVKNRLYRIRETIKPRLAKQGYTPQRLSFSYLHIFIIVYKQMFPYHTFIIGMFLYRRCLNNMETLFSKLKVIFVVCLGILFFTIASLSDTPKSKYLDNDKIIVELLMGEKTI